MAAPEQNFGDPLAGHPKFRKLKDLASGGFGFVQMCQNLHTGEVVAIKFISRGKNYVEREVVIQASIKHPHIVAFKEVFLTRTHLAIVLEYVPGGDVLQHILHNGRLSENDARWIFQQLIIGVDFLHAKGIVNRDIKLDNTMLDPKSKPLVKITDFGLSKSSEHSVAHTKVGTPDCMAPEVLTETTYCGKRADVWSCGVMLYAMLFASYPFQRLDDGTEGNDRERIREIWRRIEALDYYIPLEPAASDSAKDLIRKILVLDPGSRLTIKEIQEHPWFQIGLPPRAKLMNERFAKDDPHTYAGYQSKRDILNVIAAARVEDGYQLAQAPSTDSDTSISMPINAAAAQA